jgi:hypothetical protein
VPRAFGLAGEKDRFVSALDADTMARKLVLKATLPDDDDVYVTTECVECGRVWSYSRSGHWDDGRFYREVSCFRLSMAALKVPRPGELLALLSHENEWLRREAAWEVCCYGDALALLDHADALVREEAFVYMHQKELALDDGVLGRLAHDADVRTRELATHRLCERRFGRGEAVALLREACVEPDLVRQQAMLRVLVQALHVDDETTSTQAFTMLDAIVDDYAALVKLLAHPEHSVRRDASSIAKRALELEGPPLSATTPSLAGAVLAHVYGDDPNAAEAALRAAAGVFPVDGSVIRAVARWVSVSHTAFRAQRFLATQASRGTDVSAALPVLTQELASGADPAEIVKVLVEFLPHAVEPLVVLRALLPGLKTHWYLAAVRAFEGARKRGVDLSSMHAEIRACETAFNAAWLRQILAEKQVHHAIGDRYIEIDSLPASDERPTRYGVVLALTEPFHEENVDRLCRALCDPDREVQKLAFTGLENARKAGHTIRPSPPVLAELAEVRREDVAELVYLWTTTDTLCRICTNLNDRESSGREETLPKEKRELIQDGEESFHCPICATRYRCCWFEHDTDDWGNSVGVWELMRLAPPFGTRDKEQLHLGLSHPLRRIQRECARELGAAALARGDFPALQKLLAAEKRDVRWCTAWLLATPDASIAPLVPVLRAMFTDPDDDVRSAAAGALAHEHVVQRDADGLRAMLDIDDRMVRWRALHAIEDATDLDLEPLRTTIIGLTSHLDDFVHGPARRIVVGRGLR